MKGARLVIIVVAVVAFVAIAAFLVRASVGGGGQTRTLDVTVRGSAMTPETWTARQGDILTVNVTADKQEEIHVHGYDLAFEVESPGGTASHTFKADKTGDFPIEIEGTSIDLGKLTVSP
jgi:FtsP/CotA-like multicopper oxidase with cupredoxin domain